MSLFPLVSYSSAFLSHFGTIALQALNCLSKPIPPPRRKTSLNNSFIEVFEKIYFITKFTFAVLLIKSHSLAFNQSHKLFLLAFSSYG